MATWSEITDAAPELAAAVEARFEAGKHKTMATLRADGSPRISGTEVVFAEGGVWLGCMGGSMKGRDLLRDGRVALHAPTLDEELHDGDAKLAGVASRVTDPAVIESVWPDFPAEEWMDSNPFGIDVTEVVLTTVEGDEMVIRSWNAERGERTVRRK